MAYLLDWCGLLVRWLHVIAGIAWIGSSFYFVWLDDSLEPLGEREPPDPRVAGELWAVHGGGFYRARKYRVAPEVLPPTLHWFYWEAYTTWLSGFALLCLLYFLRAEAYLIDPSVLALSKPVAVAIAMVVIVASWLVYDALCRSPLGQKTRALAVSVAIVTTIEAWGLCQVFSGRGAFMVFGAALGSIMVANVLFVIIPGQRELVLAKREGREPDAGPGLRGKQRSVHNTYFTLPVLFVMISNHYAMTYGARYNWLVLVAMSFAGACIRGWFVARHKPEGRHGFAAAMPALLGVATLAGLVVALAPAGLPGVEGALMGGAADQGATNGSPAAEGAAGATDGAEAGAGARKTMGGAEANGPGAAAATGGAGASGAGAAAATGGAGANGAGAAAPAMSGAGNNGAGPAAAGGGAGTNGSGVGAAANGLPTIDIAQVRTIVAQRCLPCHSKNPTQAGFNAPPNGIVLETLGELRAHLPEIQKQVSLRAMPLGNLTGMTEDERAKLLMWIGHGAVGRGP